MGEEKNKTSEVRNTNIDKGKIKQKSKLRVAKSFT